MKKQQQTSRCLLLCGVLATLHLVAGCGGDGQQEVYSVKGVVKYKGKPMVGGGAIMFMPVEGGSGKEASGTIAEDGTFELKTYSPGDGAPAGEYRVVVYQTTAKEPEMAGDSDDGRPPAESEDVVPQADRIPPIYSNPTLSPVRKTIEAKENTLEIELEPAGGRQRGA